VRGLTIQERRVLIAILIALVLGTAVRYWRRQGGGEGISNIEHSTKNKERGTNSGCHRARDGEASGFKFTLIDGKTF